jgi:hypothetical protein
MSGFEAIDCYADFSGQRQRSREKSRRRVRTVLTTEQRVQRIKEQYGPDWKRSSTPTIYE